MRLLPALALALLLLPGVAGGQAERKNWPWLKQGEARIPVYPEIAVDARWARKRISDGELQPLDVRGQAAWLRGHLPGAIPLSPAEPAFLEACGGDPEPAAALLGSLGVQPERPLLLYGDELSLPEVGRLFWLLEWLGCTDVKVLRGGVVAWARSGEKLATERTQPPACRFEASPVDSLLATRSWIAARYGQGSGAELVDLRGAPIWLGEAADPSGRPGHIPHSLPYDLGELLEADALPVDLEAARNRFARFGPRENDYVDLDDVFVLYGSGPADPDPGLGYLLLRMLDVRARVYPPGWPDWASDPPLPSVRIIQAEELEEMLSRSNPGLAEDSQPAGFAFFDLRGWRDHLLRHLPGAVSLPANVVSDSLQLRVAEHWPLLDPATDPIVFYCYGVECTRSRIAASKAGHMGFEHLLILRGGVDEWRDGEFPFFGRYPDTQPPPRRVRKPAPDATPERDPRRG